MFPLDKYSLSYIKNSYNADSSSTGKYNSTTPVVAETTDDVNPYIVCMYFPIHSSTSMTKFNLQIQQYKRLATQQ